MIRGVRIFNKVLVMPTLRIAWRHCVSPRREVLSTSGESGFAMMTGDFVDAERGQPAGEVGGAEQRHPLLCRAGDEDGQLRQYYRRPQESRFTRHSRRDEQEGLLRPDNPENPKVALNSALLQDCPALVDVVSARRELVMPQKATPADAQMRLLMLHVLADGRARD
jgi:hypothetical protein